MKTQIYLDEIDDQPGGHALSLALDSFQAHLPEDNHICGCVHKIGGMVWARLQVFIDGQSYEIEWGGNRLGEFAQFIEGNLLPVLRTWSRSLPEFFQSIKFRSGKSGRACGKDCCQVYRQMTKKSVVSNG